MRSALMMKNTALLLRESRIMSKNYISASLVRFNADGDQNRTAHEDPVSLTATNQFAQKIVAKIQLQVLSANAQNQTVPANIDPTVKDEDIHPEWLAMERRVMFRKPKPRGIVYSIYFIESDFEDETDECEMLCVHFHER